MITEPNVFNDDYFYVSYSKDSGIYIEYFNSDNGTFVTHFVPIDYFLSINMEDADDLGEYLMSDAHSCPTDVWDFGTEQFATTVRDLLTDITWEEVENNKLSAYLSGMHAVLIGDNYGSVL